MDRNRVLALAAWAALVALRKESVDRNEPKHEHYNPGRVVALRKESVDRNTFCLAAGNQVV